MSARLSHEEENPRDPQDINEYVKVKFDDILAEPNDIRSPDCVWNTSHECFTCSRNCLYTFLSSICGWLLSICWGFNFACVTFAHIWCVTPGLRNISINCSAIQRCVGHAMTCCFAPMCEICSLFFSRINVIQQQQ